MPLDIPEYLKIPPEQRKAAWEGRRLTIVQADKVSASGAWRADRDRQYRKDAEDAQS